MDLLSAPSSACGKNIHRTVRPAYLMQENEVTTSMEQSRDDATINVDEIS